jgi:hypothetical protein
MKVAPNIGIINALIRITFGLTIVSLCTAKLVRRPRSNSYLIMIIMGAMKVAEGIVRYCPVTELFQKAPGMMDNGSHQQKAPGMMDNGSHQQKAPGMMDNGSHQQKDEHNQQQKDEHNQQQSKPNIPPELVDSIKSVLD